MDFFKAWFSRSTKEPFVPPPVAKEREYTPVEDLLPEKHLPPGLPSRIPDDWDLNKPFPRPEKSDILKRLGKVKIPSHVFENYFEREDQIWASLELSRKTLLFEQEKAKAEIRFAKVKAQDEQNRLDAREFDPQPEVRQYPAGVFIRYAEHEFPQKYIESITIEHRGQEPQISVDEPRIRSRYGIRRQVDDGFASVNPGDAHLSVTLGSGHSFYYTCNRWQVDKLLDVLTQAWKHGVP